MQEKKKPVYLLSYKKNLIRILHNYVSNKPCCSSAAISLASISLIISTSCDPKGDLNNETINAKQYENKNIH